MKNKSANDSRRRKKQRRVLGCAGWGLVLALTMALAFIINADIVRSGRGESALYPISDNLGAIVIWFFIFLIPIVFMTSIIGGFTEPSRSFLSSAAVMIPIVASLYTTFFYYFYSSPLGSPPKPYSETFWNPIFIGLSAVFNGIILGLIASYGYWHAGRTPNK